MPDPVMIAAAIVPEGASTAAARMIGGVALSEDRRDSSPGTAVAGGDKKADVG